MKKKINKINNSLLSTVKKRNLSSYDQHALLNQFIEVPFFGLLRRRNSTRVVCSWSGRKLCFEMMPFAEIFDGRRMAFVGKSGNPRTKLFGRVLVSYTISAVFSLVPIRASHDRRLQRSGAYFFPLWRPTHRRTVSLLDSRR